MAFIFLDFSGFLFPASKRAHSVKKSRGLSVKKSPQRQKKPVAIDSGHLGRVPDKLSEALLFIHRSLGKLPRFVCTISQLESEPPGILVPSPVGLVRLGFKGCPWSVYFP